MLRWRTIEEKLERPVDASSLGVFRVLFGVVALIGALRFFANGWIDRFFVQPTYFFQYWGFEWVQPLSEPAMYAAFGVLVISALLITVGLFYRFAIAIYFVVFTYVELIDVTNYLNHYYLVSLLAFWMCFMPLGRVHGMDARLRGALTRLPRWMLGSLQLQVACVYVFAALAKVSGDWLLAAQPLDLWLSARADAFPVSWIAGIDWAPIAMSWAGFLFDLTIVFWLSWRRTRAVAYAVLLAFHWMTHLLFDIGMFPLIMSVAATVFFDASWPRRWLALRRSRGHGHGHGHEGQGHGHGQGLPRWARLAVGGALATVALAQVVVPLRSHLYEGDVLWHEQGMRWSWRVLCREKAGSVSYRVRTPGRATEMRVPPSRYLTAHQERQMAGQPDLIVQLAHHIAEEFPGSEVRVDAVVSLNGRPPARLVDPEVDLAQTQAGLSAASWILPRPETQPPRLARNR